MGRLPSTRQWALPLDPSSALPPLHPGTKGWLPSVLPHRRSWLPPQKRCLPVSPAPYPHICAHRREVDTEYACGDCRSKHRVQTRHFDRNRPDFRRFFLPPLPPESHAPLRTPLRRLSVPRCTAAPAGSTAGTCPAHRSRCPPACCAPTGTAEGISG